MPSLYMASAIFPQYLPGRLERCRGIGQPARRCIAGRLADPVPVGALDRGLKCLPLLVHLGLVAVETATTLQITDRLDHIRTGHLLAAKRSRKGAIAIGGKAELPDQIQLHCCKHLHNGSVAPVTAAKAGSHGPRAA